MWAPWLAFESAARRAFADAVEDVSREELIETRRYGEAITRFEAVAGRFPLSSTALYDTPRQTAELTRKARELEGEPDVDAGVVIDSEGTVGSVDPGSTESAQDGAAVEAVEDAPDPDPQDWPFVLDDQ